MALRGSGHLKSPGLAMRLRFRPLRGTSHHDPGPAQQDVALQRIQPQLADILEHRAPPTTSSQKRLAGEASPNQDRAAFYEHGADSIDATGKTPAAEGGDARPRQFQKIERLARLMWRRSARVNLARFFRYWAWRPNFATVGPGRRNRSSLRMGEGGAPCGAPSSEVKQFQVALAIVGNSPDEARLKSETARRDLGANITFVSWMPQQRFLRLCDIARHFRLPGVHDSMGWNPSAKGCGRGQRHWKFCCSADKFGRRLSPPGIGAAIPSTFACNVKQEGSK
jgi:hypothetical protein